MKTICMVILVGALYGVVGNLVKTRPAQPVVSQAYTLDYAPASGAMRPAMSIDLL